MKRVIFALAMAGVLLITLPGQSSSSLTSFPTIPTAHCQTDNCAPGGPAEIDCKWKATDYLYSCIIVGGRSVEECTTLADKYLVGCMHSWGCWKFMLPSKPGSN